MNERSFTIQKCKLFSNLNEYILLRKVNLQNFKHNILIIAIIKMNIRSLFLFYKEEKNA